MPHDLLRSPRVMLRRLRRWVNDNRGTAAVSFLLVLPVFMTVVALVLQYAVLANGNNIVHAASLRVARTAVTALPEDREDEIRQSAYFALAQLSPQAPGNPAGEAVDVANALARAGIQVDDTFASRYTYAMQATEVEWPNRDYRRSNGQDIEVTIRYKFMLTVPGAKTLMGDTESVAGIDGHFYDLVSTVRIQTAHGREARAHNNGWPQ